MKNALIVTEQVFIMFLFIVIGIIARKRKTIGLSSAKEMSSITTRYIVPFIIINALQIKVDSVKIKGFALAVALGVFAHISGIIFSYLIVSRRSGDDKNNLEQLCCVMGNSSFMSFPIINAVMGGEALLYGATFLISFHLTFWTWGVYIIDGDKFDFKKFIKQPPLIAIAVGGIMFLMSIELPSLIGVWVKGMANLGTPISMIIFGIFIADTDIKKAITNYKLYRVVLVKNILIPASLILFVSIFKLHTLLPVGITVARTVAISSSSSCAITSVLFASSKNKDSAYASQIVALSTIFAIATIPLMTFIAEKFIV